MAALQAAVSPTGEGLRAHFSNRVGETGSITRTTSETGSAVGLSQTHHTVMESRVLRPARLVEDKVLHKYLTLGSDHLVLAAARLAARLAASPVTTVMTSVRPV